MNHRPSHLAHVALTVALVLAAAFALSTRAVAHGTVAPASVGSFDPSLIDGLGRIEAAKPPVDAALECGPSLDPPVSASRKPRPLSMLLNSEDDDAVHYARGSTLYYHVFINHNGGTWSQAERDTAAAKAAMAANFYMAVSPPAANLSFQNFGNTTYYYSTATVNYLIDTLDVVMIGGVLASLGYTDDDGDGAIQDDFALYWQTQLGGWDNVAVVYQPADLTGRANASSQFSRIIHYVDDASSVWRHELGHLFGSCDEYSEGVPPSCSNGTNCGLCQGWYLSVSANNGNCDLAICGTPVQCVMDNNVPFVCGFTNVHWGWNDADLNGQLDFTNRQTTAGNFVPIRELAHNGFFTAASTTAGYVAAQQWESWAAFGMRSPVGTDYDLRMYLDNNHNYLAASSLTSQRVDFVVGDYNHSNLGNEHFIASLESGPANNYTMSFESGTGTLYPDGQSSGTQTWNDYQVVRAYEVPLFAGETITFTLDILTGSLDLGMALFKSNNAAHYAPRTSAVASDDNGGVGVTETFTYTVPSDDVYGLVVWANSNVDGTFDIQIGPTPLTLLEDVSVLSGFDLRLYDFSPLSGYWGVVGTRPESDTNTDLTLFDDANYLTERATSTYGNGVVDFIAIDYNHATAATDHLRVAREVGAGNHRTEWEQGSDTITGAESFTWEDLDIVEAWDVFLEAGHSYFVRQYHSGVTFDSGIYLMGSDTGTGDYWEGRPEFKAGSNVQAPATGGEWFSYSPPADDWYGIVMLTNNAVSPTAASIWVGPQIPLADDVRLSRNQEVVFGTATPFSSVWNVAGLRSTGAEITHLSLYDDASYSAAGFKATDVFAGPVRYIVGDWNHNTAGTMYARTQRTAGTGYADIEWEGGGETLTYNAAGHTVSNQFWNELDVAEVWDLFLPANSPVAVMVEVLNGDLDVGVELFKSNGAEYYATRGQGVVSADQFGSGVREVITTTTGPSADFYGLVVYNKTDASGNYRIHIWNPNVVDAGGPAAPRELALAAAPNPSRDAVALHLSLPREGDVALELFDVQGRLVRTLAQGRMAAGVHPLRWDGRDEAGIVAEAGLYLARLRSGGEERNLRLVRTR